MYKKLSKTNESYSEEVGMKSSAKKCSMMYFYADWCPHCTRFGPEVEKAAQSATASQKNIVLEKNNDETTTAELKKKYNIKGYPTLYFVKDQEQPTLYEGPRTADSIEEFMRSL
jgi:thiol:disulfide interchange protein